MNADEKQETYSNFMDCVNMQPQELEDWLETEKSKSVGDSDGGRCRSGYPATRLLSGRLRTDGGKYLHPAYAV